MAQEQKIFAEIQTSDNMQIKCSTISENGVDTAMDIRNWYLDKATNTYKPTQKGVRIKQEFLAEVIKGVLENVDADTKEDLIHLLEL